MAYVRRIPHSPYWIAGFRRPDGKYAQRSTRLRDRRAALKVAGAFEAAGRDRLAETQARHVLSDIYESINGKPLVTPSFAGYREQWLARKAVEVRPLTLAHYKGAIADFESHLQRRAQESLHYLTQGDVASWRDRIAARASARTANNKLKVLRVFLKSAWRDGLILDNVAAKVSILRALESTRRPFSMAEAEAVWNAATGEWKGIILFGLYTGQRLSDIALLTWGKIDRAAGLIRFTTSKTGRRQEIPLAPPIQSYLDDLPELNDPNEPLFPKAHRIIASGQSAAPLSQQFHHIMAKAGLATPRPKKHRKTTGLGRSAKRVFNPLSFHSLRHTTTSMLKACGVAESVVRDIIGHESVAVSQHYTHVAEDLKRDAVGRLPRFSESSTLCAAV